MNRENVKKLICLGLCIVLFAAFSLAVPDFWNFDISYKNEKLDVHIPNTVSEDVKREKFTLPLVYIYSHDIDRLMPQWEWKADGPVMPPREESSVDLYVFDRGENSLEDIPNHIYYDEMMKLRGRTSSYMQEKKPFSLEFRNDDGLPVNYNFLGFKPESDFVFHAPYIDRSLIRNFMAYNLMAQTVEWAPRCQYVEVFVDTPGSEVTMEDYQGVYLIVEKIKQDKNRIPMGEYKIPENNDNLFREGGNIIFKRDHFETGYDQSVMLDKTDYGNRYCVEYPKAENLDEAGIDAISQEVNYYEQVLFDGSDEEFAQLYDIEQIANVMLVTELMKNYEAFSASLYYYRPRGEKINILQWDFDLGTGNADYEEDMSNMYGFKLLTKERIQPYMQHENFCNAVISQWKELRSEGGALSEENIIALLDDAESQLEGAWQRNDERFVSAFEEMPFGNVKNDFKNSQEEREFIRKYLTERGRWLDEHIDEIAELY